MKKLLLFFLCVFIGMIGAVVYLRMQSKIEPAKIVKEPAFSIAAPPKESLAGKIVSMTGEVQWESRTATQPTMITQPISIQQGENIYTNDKGTVGITFDTVGTVDVKPKSEVDFIQTLPSNFVISQVKGSVVYNKTGTIPFSVRSGHLLAMIDGEATVSFDEKEPEITVAVKKGTATIGYNDMDNVSHVEKISAGKRVVFNEETRDVDMEE